MAVEGRGFIKSIEETKRKIEALGAKFKNNYAFTDYIFIPKKGRIDLNQEVVRVRVYKLNNWPGKDVVLTEKVTERYKGFKTSKTKLRKEFDKQEEAFNFLKNRFRKYIEYFREGWYFDLDGVRLWVEDIKGFKPTIEIEAATTKELEAVFKQLGVKERVSDSVPRLMERHLPKTTPGVV
jgi:adenylate cyclase class IV